MSKKTKTNFSAEIIQRAVQSRFNPLPNLTPEKVVSWHAAFKRGHLRMAALAWNSIMETDDMVITVAPKREKAVSRHGFEVLTVDDSDRAKAHARTLEEFYNNLVATDAVDQNERGGFPMLVRQMMKATGMKYAVHEIVWKPGAVFSAEFRAVPLWFFENTTGKLRFLKDGYGQTGDEMPAGEWMVTTGDGIMAACTACYLFKHLPLQDWLIFSERYGMPLTWGESPAEPGTDAWTAMEDALRGISGGEEVVVTAGSSINVAEFKAAGQLPYKELVERMDRAMAAMWRGGDLGTMSKGDAVGANAQGDESDLLENDDARSITDVLNEQVDKFVIKYVHGDAVPLARVKVKESISQDMEIDLKIDEGLREAGFEEPIEEVQKRYNRPYLMKRIDPAVPGGDLSVDMVAENSKRGFRLLSWLDRLRPAANSKEEKQQAALRANTRKAMAIAVAADLEPVVDRLTEILDTVADEDFLQALEDFQTVELPALATEVLDDPAAADAIADTLSANLLNGMAAGNPRVET